MCQLRQAAAEKKSGGLLLPPLPLLHPCFVRERMEKAKKLEMWKGENGPGAVTGGRGRENPPGTRHSSRVRCGFD